MKAIRYTTYGSPDVLQLQEVAQPTPQADEILVKVVAAAVNPLDWHLLRADPFIARFGNGLFKPKNHNLGADVSGRVESVGANVTQFKVGDAVFGLSPIGILGGLAEYICLKERLTVHKPSNLTFEQAAAVPVAAFTAYEGLRKSGQIKSGQKVLINGASGGVGSFAVQIAKAFNTQVTAVCSTRNVELVRSIGADEVIDYTQQDFTRTGRTYDLVFDAVGNRSVGELRRILTPAGKCVVAGFTSLGKLFQLVALGLIISKTSSQQMGLLATVNPGPEDLKFLKELLEMGQMTPIIDRTYPLSQTAEAIRYLETGRARGKVVVTVP